MLCSKFTKDSPTCGQLIGPLGALTTGVTVWANIALAAG